MKKIILSLMLGFISFNSSAGTHGGMQFGLGTFDANLTGSGFTGATTESKSRFNGRLYLVSDMNIPSFFEAETGLTVGEQAFAITQSGATNTYIRPRMTLDFLLRLRIPFLSIGAGGFWGITPWAITQESATTLIHRSASSAGFAQQDFGLLGSIRLAIPMGPFAIAVDFRKLWGTHDINNTETAEARSRETQLFFGFEFR